MDWVIRLISSSVIAVHVNVGDVGDVVVGDDSSQFARFSTL